jgi:hypothetical protein
MAALSARAEMVVAVPVAPVGAGMTRIIANPGAAAIGTVGRGMPVLVAAVIDGAAGHGRRCEQGGGEDGAGYGSQHDFPLYAPDGWLDCFASLVMTGASLAAGDAAIQSRDAAQV